MSKPSPQRERLTKRLIDAAEAGPSERFIWDNEVTGFGLRITPRGKKAFIYQYRMRGEKIARRYLTLYEELIVPPEYRYSISSGRVSLPVFDKRKSSSIS